MSSVPEPVGAGPKPGATGPTAGVGRVGAPRCFT